MAVDTREKRFSMMSFGDGAILHVLFESDGAVDLDDRQHLLGLYSGIALAPPGGVAGQLLSLTHGRHGTMNILSGGMG